MDTVGIELKTPLISINDLPEGTTHVCIVVKHGTSFIRCYNNHKKIASILYNEETKSYIPTPKIDFSEEGISYDELLDMGVNKEELDSLLNENI